MEAAILGYGFFDTPEFPTHPSAAIDPNARYKFCGTTIARAAKELRRDIERVIILAYADRCEFEGIAIPDNTEFQTVFGAVQVQTKSIRQASTFPFVNESPAPFEIERVASKRCYHGLRSNFQMLGSYL